MQASEGIGAVGWVVLALVVLAILVAVLFGFSRLLLLALPLTVAALAVILLLCGGSTRTS